MSRQPEGYLLDDLTVVARRVLLDALLALTPHAAAVIVVGAQAISLRAERARLPTLSSFTSDADLGLDPRQLSDDPRIEQAMTAAGFSLAAPPGTWSRRELIGLGETEVMVDLLVPESLAGDAPRKARGGRIPPHAKTATRRVRGLEATVVDSDVLLVRSLEPGGTTVADARVAGVAALLIAKAHKIADRLADKQPGRLQDKDAADVVRLMQIETAAVVADRFQRLIDHDVVGDTARDGLALLRTQFGSPGAVGTRLAVAALSGISPRTRIEALCPAFLRRLPET